MRRSNSAFETPLFFKLWFAFVAGCIICLFAGMIYVGTQAVSAGPEGVGRTIGGVIKGIDEGRK